MYSEYSKNFNKIHIREELKNIRKKLTFKQRYSKSFLIQKYLLDWVNVIREKSYKNKQPCLFKIACFWPTFYEPNLLPLFSKWALSKDFIILLPVITKYKEPLKFRKWKPKTLTKIGFYGIREPKAGSYLIPDILLVPTLGYTMQGDRLGYGGDIMIELFLISRIKVLFLQLSGSMGLWFFKKLSRIKSS
ncbi:MAG: hypothetical protein IR526_02920 [Bordetella sp.]|nr:MAG: hypothetical protein IR526_02920 [Bordetella sp.]